MRNVAPNPFVDEFVILVHCRFIIAHPNSILFLFGTHSDKRSPVLSCGVVVLHEQQGGSIFSKRIFPEGFRLFACIPFCRELYELRLRHRHEISGFSPLKFHIYVPKAWPPRWLCWSSRVSYPETQWPVVMKREWSHASSVQHSASKRLHQPISPCL